MSIRWRAPILAASILATTTTARADDPGTARSKLVMVARDRSRGIKLGYRAAGDGVVRRSPRTRFEIRGANDPVPLALAVAGGTGEGRALLADGLTAVPADVRGVARPIGRILTMACTSGAEGDACGCMTFGTCTRRVVGRGAGTKLECRGAEAEVSCTAEKGLCFGRAGCVLDARRDDDGGAIAATYALGTLPRSCAAGVAAR